MTVTAALARGVVAGVVGAVAMTVSQLVEMSVSGREPSSVPGQVGAHLVPGRDPGSAHEVQALDAPVHWVHGLVMGAVRGAIDLAGVRGPAAGATHFALLWSADAALYRALGIADVPWRWKPGELAADVAHKAVYAAVTAMTYDALRRRGAEHGGARARK